MLLCCATEKWSIAMAPLADHVHACGVVRLKRCKDRRLETQSCRHPKDSKSWYIHASLPDASGAHSSWSTFEMAVRLSATVPHALAQTNMWLSVRTQNWIHTYLRFQAGKNLDVLPTVQTRPTKVLIGSAQVRRQLGMRSHEGAPTVPFR